MYIDLLLEEAGRNFDKNVKIERKVSDSPSESGHDYVNYFLMGDNELPFVVVEAKRLSKSPESAQQQVKLYANSLEKETGQRPIIFYSNSYQTYIWNDKGGMP